MNCDSERRRQILEAAERLLRQHGPAKTTMAEIAREASVGVGSVYLEFPSKDAIVEELSTGRHALVLAAMRCAASAAAATWADRFRAVLDAKVDAMFRAADEGAHAADLVHCGQSAVQSAHARFLCEERALVEGLLRAATREGEFRVEDPASTAALVLSAYARFSPPWLFHAPRAETLAALAAMHDLVLRGLLTRA